MRSLVDFWFRPADCRHYTALRIGYALASLAQLITLWPLRHAFFSEDGMISAADFGVASLVPSLFSFASSPLAVTAAFAVMAIAMVTLAWGVVPRAGLALVFYWHYSLASDLSPAISGYDMVLKLLGFLLLISPTKKEGTAPAYGLYLIRWQLLCIYWNTVWLKLPDPSWRNGQFTAYFMMSLYSLFPSAAFAHAEAFSVAMTYLTLAIEVAVPVLLFLPRGRWLGVVLGLLLHVGIAVTSNLWLFSLSMLVLYPAFVSPADWKEWRNALARVKARLAA